MGILRSTAAHACDTRKRRRGPQCGGHIPRRSTVRGRVSKRPTGSRHGGLPAKFHKGRRHGPGAPVICAAGERPTSAHYASRIWRCLGAVAVLAMPEPATSELAIQPRGLPPPLYRRGQAHFQLFGFWRLLSMLAGGIRMPMRPPVPRWRGPARWTSPEMPGPVFGQGRPNIGV